MKKKITAFAAALAVSLCGTVFPAYAVTGSAAQENVDYSSRDNWAFWDFGDEKDADMFIVCPMVDMGKAGNMNADISDEKFRSSFVGALNMELGIYTDTASVYSPFYRQATFPVYSLDDADREPYLQVAYNDVRDAFLYYCDNCDESRPLILAGFSQGADMIIRLMTEFYDNEKYMDRLVAAYAIGWKLTEKQTEEYPWLRPAQGEDDTGVIITFNSEAGHITSSMMIGENEHTYSINPLNWKTDSTPADRSLNKGACFTDYDGNIDPEIPELTGAYIDEKRGALKVTDIDEADYPAVIFDEGIFHIYDYQFFFRNLQENVARRTAEFMSGRVSDTSASESENTAYSLSVEAVADCSECYVGDKFIVSITAENTGNTELTDVTVYFEDTPVQTAETLAAGDKLEFQIKLQAWESDIESGGIINITADAGELAEPVKTVISVKVSMPEENPGTGAGAPAVLLLSVSGIAVVVFRRKQRNIL